MKFSEYVNEEKSKQEQYQAFFKKMLKKFGVESPDELDDEKKKAFFDAIDKGWKGEDETNESLDEAYSISTGFTGAEDMLNRLEKILDPNSNLCKGISKGLGGDYKPEFKEMSKHLARINDIWGEIRMTVDMQD